MDTIIKINDSKRDRLLTVEKCEDEYRIVQNTKVLARERYLEKLLIHIPEIESAMEVRYRLYIAIAQYQLDRMHEIDVSIKNII